MHCPFCGFEETQVKDSRPSDDGAAIRRRRACSSCGARFTTFERVQLRDLVVQKSDGELEPFDRNKLIRSMRLALSKRPVTDEQIERLANSIVRQLETSGENEVKTKDIGLLVMNALENLDKVGYIRYASVYKDFREVSDFNEFLDDIGRLKIAKKS